MKKFLTFAISAFAALFLAGCSLPDGSTTVVNYNNEIIDIQKSMINSYDALLNQVSAGTIEELNTAYDEFLLETQASQLKIATLNDYKGDSMFLDAIKDYVNTFENLAKNEMKEAVTILSKDEDSITDEDEERYDELVTSIDETTRNNDNNFITTQEEFATKYNMTLESADYDM